MTRAFSAGWNLASLGTWTTVLAMVSSKPQGEPSGAAAEAYEADAELVSRARTGDRKALNAIYRTHRAAVGRHVLMLTHDASAVDDLVQDTFITAFDRLDQYTGSSRLSTWLHGIALNLARNHRAKGRRRRGLLERFWRRDEAESTEHPEGAAREKESLAVLYRALDELDAGKREAFILRVIEQVPLHEASEVLGAPIATVSYRARQAETAVRQYLKQHGVEA